MDWTDPDIKRQAYLHESGHAIVAVEHKMIVHEIICDGSTGFCRADLSATAEADFNKFYLDAKAGTITKEARLKNAIGVFFDKLCSFMGGVAGESLLLGRGIYSTRRASDDCSAFFGFLSAHTDGLSAVAFTPIYIDAFTRAQDDAWSIVRRRHADVEKLADALQVKGSLSGAEFAQILGP
jgi:hypothetical protein